MHNFQPTGMLFLVVTSLHFVLASPGKWSWGPLHTTSLPNTFPDSRLPHAPPTIPEEEEEKGLNQETETNSKLRSLCSAGNGLDCPSGISKGVFSTGSDISSNGPPIALVQHHHFHTHTDKGAMDARSVRQSSQFPAQVEASFPHPILFGGQADFSSQSQNPLSAFAENPSLGTGQRLPQLSPSGQPFSPGSQLLGQNPTSFIGNPQQPFSEHPQPPSSHPASLPMSFPQTFPAEQRPLPLGGQFPSPIGQQLLPPNPLHVPDANLASLPENQHPLLSPDIPPYREQCQCIHPTLCGPADVVPRLLPTDPLTHLLIDPRTLGTDILSNATDLDANEKPFADDSRANNTGSGESRLRRSTFNDTEAKTRNVQNHLLEAYHPGAFGCQESHVCCRVLFSETLQNQFGCGIRNSQGLLGRSKSPKLAKGDSEFGEHPWQAAILMDAHGESVYVCGAVLITNRHALTAAHCVNSLQSSVLKVRLGEWDVSGEIEFLEHLDVPVAEVRSHPQYYAGNLNNDISLLTLQHLVDFSSNPHISPVCLPESSEIFIGQRCYSTGWGKDSFGNGGQYQQILKEVEVPIVSHELCQEALKGTRLGPGFSLHEGMMCAGGEAKRDSCTGDGGGPLVCHSPDGIAHLAGLVSWGIGCGQLGIPGVYVNVPYYMNWILTYLKT